MGTHSPIQPPPPPGMCVYLFCLWINWRIGGCPSSVVCVVINASCAIVDGVRPTSGVECEYGRRVRSRCGDSCLVRTVPILLPKTAAKARAKGAKAPRAKARERAKAGEAPRAMGRGRGRAQATRGVTAKGHAFGSHPESPLSPQNGISSCKRPIHQTTEWIEIVVVSRDEGATKQSQSKLIFPRPEMQGNPVFDEVGLVPEFLSGNLIFPRH